MGVVVAQVQVIAATLVHIAALAASRPTPPVGALVDPRSPAQAMPTILYRIVGTFTHQALWDFTSLTSLPAGLIASDCTINDMAGNPSAKYNHVFQPANVAVSGSYLQLRVPGGQTTSPMK